MTVFSNFFVCLVFGQIQLLGQKTLNHPHDVLKRYRTWLDEKLPQTAHLKVVLDDLESKNVPADQICRLMSLHDEWTPEGNSNNHHSTQSASSGFMRQASLPPFLRNAQTQRPVFNFGTSVPANTTVITTATLAGDVKEHQHQEPVSTPNEGPMSSSSHSELGDGQAAGESVVLSPSTSPLINTVRKTGVTTDSSPNPRPSSFQISSASQSRKSAVPNEIIIAQATSDESAHSVDSSGTKAEQLDKLNHRYDRLTRNCQSHKRRLLQLKKALREAKLLYESTRKERSEVKRQISTFEHLRAAERRLLLGGTVKTAVNLEEGAEEDRNSDTSAMDLDSSYENISSILEADVSELLNDSSTIESSIACHSSREDSITMAPVNQTWNDSGTSQTQNRDSIPVSANNVLTDTTATKNGANDIIGNESRKSIPTGKPFAALPPNTAPGALEEKGFSVSEPKLIDIDKSAVAEEQQQRERAYDSSRSRLPSKSKLLSESQLSTPKIDGIEKSLRTSPLLKPNAYSSSGAMEQSLAKDTHRSVQNHTSTPAAYSSVVASPSQIRSASNLSSPPMLQRENIFTSESIDIEIPPFQARSVSAASTESPIVPAYIGDMAANLPSKNLTHSPVQNQPISSAKRSKTERSSQNDDNGEWPASQDSPFKRRKTGEKLDSQITVAASIASGVTPSPPKNSVRKHCSHCFEKNPSQPLHHLKFCLVNLIVRCRKMKLRLQKNQSMRHPLLMLMFLSIRLNRTLDCRCNLIHQRQLPLQKREMLPLKPISLMVVTRNRNRQKLPIHMSLVMKVI
ncbi:hypothetical protein BKA69DRAFT_3331 [Paraphysoderma sedebokerense]|nr:hypothetical protein BKA69DRAFT_3331 [Paraphysoderma sedebokerense]